MKRIMVTGPFSAWMTAIGRGAYSFSTEGKKRLEKIHGLLDTAGYEVLSAHRADAFGESPWMENFVERDLTWASTCDVQLVLLPAESNGAACRSDGTMIEVGFALAHDRPIVFLAEDIDHPSNSFFLRSFAERNVKGCIRWQAGYETQLMDLLTTLAPVNTGTHRPREQRTHVEQVIEELRRDIDPHKVVVAGCELTVLPGVLSPRLSHAPDALVSKWHIASGAEVLDLGCGSGVLGILALRSGAGRLVALDLNEQAVKTAALNLTELGMTSRGEARPSDTYSALRPGESFDVIIFAAPYWDRPAGDALELAFFDAGFAFFRRAITEAHHWLKPGGDMYIVFSDQGDVSLALRIIDASHMRVQEMHLFRPSTPDGHIRVVWHLVRRGDATSA